MPASLAARAAIPAALLLLLLLASSTSSSQAVTNIRLQASSQPGTSTGRGLRQVLPQLLARRSSPGNTRLVRINGTSADNATLAGNSTLLGNDTANATSANVARFSGRIPLPLPNTTIPDNASIPNITANATLDGTNSTNSTSSLVRIDTDEGSGSGSSGPAVSGFDRVVESIKDTAASAGSKVVDLFKSAGDAISGFFG